MLKQFLQMDFLKPHFSEIKVEPKFMMLMKKKHKFLTKYFKHNLISQS